MGIEASASASSFALLCFALAFLLHVQLLSIKLKLKLTNVVVFLLPRWVGRNINNSPFQQRDIMYFLLVNVRNVGDY